MERHKELLDDDLTLAPIKLLGGFVCVDFHLGCSGCLYCLNRRHPFLHALLEQRMHLDMPFEPAQLAEMVLALPSVRDARVPVRMGHVTDWVYQKEATTAFCASMPRNYPMVAMTRYPLDQGQIDLLTCHPSLLAHVTLSPPIPGIDNGDALSVIASTQNLPRNQVVYMLRPLVIESPVREFLKALPPQSWVAFGAMSTDSIPQVDHLRPMSHEEIDNLRDISLSMELRPLHMFGCLLRQRAQRPFFKYRSVAKLPSSHCPQCANLSLCHTTLKPLPPEKWDDFHASLDRLGVEKSVVHQEPGALQVETPTPAGRGEEVFLSELYEREVTLTTVTRGQEKGVRFLDQALYKRWQERGFLPVGRLREMAMMIRRLAPTLDDAHLS